MLADKRKKEMVRKVRKEDAATITAIYNECLQETESVSNQRDNDFRRGKKIVHLQHGYYIDMAYRINGGEGFRYPLDTR
ncbi:MAG: hypothetical protein H6544_04010 [Prevotellaceae bacterium]|nr:hypothetical protein [Prevotellaceae bacterium]